MSTVVINIDDSELPGLKKFVRGAKAKMRVIKEDAEEIFAIPEWQKEETLHRLKTSKQTDFIPWAKAKKQLKSK
ncbi:MAG TPA: hypothetical protein VK809_07380 [Bacteroidia bacterium]|jgi:hypothetical protein|nr:hypothetical protein [Bacteroidia bacterium]